MRHALCSLAMGALALALAPAASAQVTAIVTGGSTTVKFPTGAVTRYSHNSSSQLQNPGTNEYGNYQVVSNVSGNVITFANNVSAEGVYSYVSSSTKLAVTFRNGSSTAVVPNLLSTIDPGGFGAYAAQNVADPVTMTIADINKSKLLTNPNVTLNRYLNRGDPYLAGASFSMTVSSKGQTIESLSGLLTISPSANGGPATAHLTLGGNASLTGFGLVTTAGSDRQVGYQWDPTNLALTLPGGALAPGASRTLTYQTTVTAFTDGMVPFHTCSYFTCPTLFAYSGFGDPLGKGSGGNAATLATGASPAGEPAGSSGVTFNRFTSTLPSFDPVTGTINLGSTTGTLPSLPLTAVPEPGSWALTILGIGLTGVALRRRVSNRAAVA